MGVFPIDYLPRKLHRLPALFIINTNTSNLPGQHWKAVCISTQHTGEVFDSLAMPVSLRLQQWMNMFTKNWTFTTVILQNPLSPTCGGYVLYFVMTRLKRKSLAACIRSFKANLMDNDAFIERYLHAYLR